MQQLKSVTRARIGDDLYDIDFDCSHPSIIIDLCNKQNIPVPEIINTIVTERELIRQELSIHYYGSVTQEGIKFSKQQINAFLYGQRINTRSPFIENNVPEKSHPPKIKLFSKAMDILVLGSLDVPSIIPLADINATKRRGPSRTGLRLFYAALSDLAARVESQKLHCILSRLTTYWGVDCNGTILMHDGAMISMSDLHPAGKAVLLSKTSLDQEILRDLTNYCRNTLKAYCKISVKCGSQATDLNCGVPWPILDNHPIPQPNPTNRNYIGGTPDLISLERTEHHRITSPSTRISFMGPTMIIEYKPPQSPTYSHQLKLSLWRALSLIICHSGTPATLFSSISNLLWKTLYIRRPGEFNPLRYLASPHPELLEWIQSLGAKSYICTPTNVPIYYGPLRPSPHHRHLLFPGAPIWPFKGNPYFTISWPGATFQDYTTDGPWHDGSDKPISVVAAVNRFGAPLIPYLNSKFTKAALLGHPCFLLMEKPQTPTQTKISPLSKSARVRCTKIASFPSHCMPYRSHSGPIIDPTPTPTTTPSPAIKNKQTKSSSPLNNWSHDKTYISSPFADGRWDMDKSTPILLNQNTATLYAFHQTDHPIYITPKQKTTLVEILVRIATPMDHRGEPEWGVPLLF